MNAFRPMTVSRPSVTQSPFQAVQSAIQFRQAKVIVGSLVEQFNASKAAALQSFLATSSPANARLQVWGVTGDTIAPLFVAEGPGEWIADVVVAAADSGEGRGGFPVVFGLGAEGASEPFKMWVGPLGAAPLR